MVTCTSRKETAANTLLRADSHHPIWLKDGIPVGQFLRIKRNCTKPTLDRNVMIYIDTLVKEAIPIDYSGKQNKKQLNMTKKPIEKETKGR